MALRDRQCRAQLHPGLFFGRTDLLRGGEIQIFAALHVNGAGNARDVREPPAGRVAP
jgi:hypothetical protein